MALPEAVDFSITTGQQMLASCSGSLVTSMMGESSAPAAAAAAAPGPVTPLDVVKIRLQAQEKQFLSNKCFLYCNGLMEHICYCNGNGSGSGGTATASGNGSLAYGKTSIHPSKWFKRPGQFNGTLDAFVKIARTEGLSSLWSGLPPTLVMAVPATVVYFTIYDQLRAKICKWRKYETQPLWVPVVAGGSARVIAATTISPLEMIRTKMQSKKLSYWEVGRAVRTSVETQGYLSLWRGLSATLLRDVPFSCLYWANYEYLKMKYGEKQPSFWFSFAAGATSGTIAAVITLPFDVVKTHRQIELGEQEASNGKRSRSLASNRQKTRTSGNSNEKSTRTIMNSIYSKRGIRGLFSGIVPRIVKVAPACAIMISTYEYGKAFFRQYNASRHRHSQTDNAEGSARAI